MDMWQVVSDTMSLRVVATGKSLPNRARLAQRIDRLDRKAPEVGRPDTFRRTSRLSRTQLIATGEFGATVAIAVERTVQRSDRRPATVPPACSASCARVRGSSTGLRPPARQLAQRQPPVGGPKV